MSIPFTQYLRPDGCIRHQSVERPDNIESLAKLFISYGGKFEAEVLTTGHVSLTACMLVDGEWQDVAIRICSNGPEILEAVDSLVKEAVNYNR